MFQTKCGLLVACMAAVAYTCEFLKQQSNQHVVQREGLQRSKRWLPILPKQPQLLPLGFRPQLQLHNISRGTLQVFGVRKCMPLESHLLCGQVVPVLAGPGQHRALSPVRLTA